MEEENQVRSEEVEEIINRNPGWLVNWGSCLLGVIVFLLLCISWVIRYPDIVKVRVRITTQQAPYPVSPKSNGRLARILVKDDQDVKKGTPLAVMEATGNYEEIMQLQKRLQGIGQLVEKGEIPAAPFARYTRLGDIQPYFQTFIQAHKKSIAFFTNSYYRRKKNYILDEITDLQKLEAKDQEQWSILEREMEIAHSQFSAQKLLFGEKVISQFDLNNAEDTYLNKQRPIKQLERVIIDLQTQKKNKEKEILELDRQATELESDFNQAFNTLMSQIETWKSNFMLVSPAAGNLNYAEPLQENSQVTESSELFYVIPPGNKLLGVARVPQVNSGQIRKGQPVIIKFAGYPFERYGTVDGVVEDIAWVTSRDSTFLTQVRLPGGITTNNGKRLVFRNGMMGTAEIITRDSRLIDHFLYEIRLALAQ